MPWLDDNDPSSVTDSFLNRKVAAWPNPNTNRIDARFRHTYGTLAPAPRASRYLFRFTPEIQAEDPKFNCYLDLLAVSDTVLQGSSGPHPVEGWDIKLTVTNFIDPSVDPVYGKSGIEYRWTISFPGEPDWDFWSMYDKEDWLGGGGIPWTVLGLFNDHQFLNGNDLDPVLNPSFPAAPRQSIAFWSVSECWSFPAPPAPSLFAEFNELGETYHLDGFAPNFGPTWRVEYDIRQRGTGNINVYGWSGHPNVRHYWAGRFCSWNAFNVDTVDALPLDTWIHILFDFEWDTPASQILRVIKDGGTPITRVIACTGIYGDRFGQAGGSPVGIFDLKNFTCLYGDDATPRVGHDCPMTTNACDVGPNLMGGDTTVMALPSCPP